MAQVDIDVIQQEDGTVKIAIIHCDGTAGEYKTIPCPCPTSAPGSGETDPPVYPSTERCTMANGYMFAYIAMLQQFWTRAKAQPDNILGNMVAASQAASETYNYPVYNIRYSGYLALYGVEFEAIEFTIPAPGVGEQYDPVLEQELVCLAHAALEVAGDAFNQDWFDFMSAQFVHHSDLGSFTHRQWELMGVLHDVLTLEYWQHYAPQYALDPGGFAALPCDECEAPTSPCDERTEEFPFNNSVAEGYFIVNGTQGAGYIAGAPIPAEGFPEYSIPGVADATSRGAYILLALNIKIARVSVTFRYRRFDGTNSGVGHLLYCYDEANLMLFGGPLGGSTTSPQDTDLTFNFDISGVGVCIHHAVLAVNFGSSKPSVQYIQVLHAETFLTLE